MNDMLDKLIKWSLENFSHLPWRKNRNLYTTLVSEIMLQQTTVPTVLNYYKNFLAKYPDIKSLAQTTDHELQLSWKGLGYYRRAENLLKAARYIDDEFDGVLPLDFEKLIKIPGIGQYTANALISIGGNKKALALDGNLERVLGRYYHQKGEKGSKFQKHLYSLFQQGQILESIKELGPSHLNEALMDLGRTICKPKNPKCQECPLEKECLAQKNKTIELYPYPYGQKKADEKKSLIDLQLLRVFVLKGNKILVYKKNQKEWLKNQYEVPTFIIETEEHQLKQYPLLNQKIKKGLKTYKSSITKYKITNHILVTSEENFKREFPFNRETDYIPLDFEKENLASNIKKAYPHLFQD